MEYPFRTKPFEHQLEAWNISRDMTNFALLMEMGTAKSKIAIDTIGWLWLQGKISAVLILCPNGLQDLVWRTQFGLHMPKQVRYDFQRFTRLKKFERAFKEFYKPHNEAPLKVIAMNIEAIRPSKNNLGYKVARKFLESWPALMLIDEAHRIKTPGAKQTMRAQTLGKRAQYRRILTGTAITRNPLDLYAQFRFLDWEIIGQETNTSFKAFYAEWQRRIIKRKGPGGKTKKIEWDELTSFRNLPHLQTRIRPFTYTKKKKDCLDLPPKLHETRPVEFSPEQKKYYNQLIKEEAASLDLTVDRFEDILIENLTSDTPTILVKNALAREMRLQQLLCGRFVDRNNIAHVIPSNRITVLKDILEECPGKVIVWARFTADIDLIIAALTEQYGKFSCVAYHGKISSAQRQENYVAFRGTSAARFFIGEPSTGGIGLDLLEPETVIYYSQSYKWDDRVQSEDRVHRAGLDHKVTYVTLITPGTIDEKILQNHADKSQIADEFYSGI